MVMPAIYPITCHTDHVGAGSTFVVVQGFAHNGCDHIPLALKKGASRIVVDQELSSELCFLITKQGAKLERVENARKALACLSAQASDHAHKKLKLIGITGTKGKTTTAHLLFHILKNAGIKVGLLSTVGNAIGEMHLPASLTTPQPDYLHQFFATAVAHGCEWIVMEVAAQAISLHRIEQLEFDVAIMTNFDRDHLEFYDSMESYFADKVALLEYRKPDAPVWINKDDARLSKLHPSNARWFSYKERAELTGILQDTQQLSLHAQISYHNKTYSLHCPALAGDYNLSNAIAAVGAAQSVGIDLVQSVSLLSTFAGIAGRQERISLSNGAIAIIDYAHNPQSYEAFFKTVRPHTNHLLVVFGAGGNRDTGKRPQMGALAAQYADLIIITTDNPRHEDPEAIEQDILRGISQQDRKRVICEPDRKRAIEKAYALSRKGSIIALLGKGPDEYQLIGDQKIPFSERKILFSQ
ncbi:UDP-N-acetylmuramoyl-L-alanyl-D-glutamate--2,6-diaminopimelate ligase [Candidatus Dependentiae bacterium]